MQITALGEHIGAECTGLDARQATAQDIDTLKNALARHGVIAIRDQDLGPRELADFGRKFGELEFSVRERFRLEEQPEVYVISNIVENGKQLGNPNDGFTWHTDASYMEYPTAYTFLKSIEVPPEGADTLFATTAPAYDDLTPAEHERFDTMQAVHSHERLQAQRTWDKPLSETESERVPDVVHPLVRTHPLTGRKALYFGIRTLFPIGVADEDRLPFISDLVERCTRPGYVYAHKWRVNDLVVWDNRALIHRATEYDKQKYRRLLHRISVKGERPF